MRAWRGPEINTFKSDGSLSRLEGVGANKNKALRVKWGTALVTTIVDWDPANAFSLPHFKANRRRPSWKSDPRLQQARKRADGQYGVVRLPPKKEKAEYSRRNAYRKKILRQCEARGIKVDLRPPNLRSLMSTQELVDSTSAIVKYGRQEQTHDLHSDDAGGSCKIEILPDEPPVFQPENHCKFDETMIDETDASGESGCDSEDEQGRVPKTGLRPWVPPSENHKAARYLRTKTGLVIDVEVLPDGLREAVTKVFQHYPTVDCWTTDREKMLRTLHRCKSAQPAAEYDDLVKINGVDGHKLINDDGSQLTFMSEKYIEAQKDKCKIRVIPSTPIQVELADGKLVQSNKVAVFDLIIDTKVHQVTIRGVRASILPGDFEGVLLGRPELESLGFASMLKQYCYLKEHGVAKKIKFAPSRAKQRRMSAELTDKQQKDAEIDLKKKKRRARVAKQRERDIREGTNAFKWRTRHFRVPDPNKRFDNATEGKVQARKAVLYRQQQRSNEAKRQQEEASKVEYKPCKKLLKFENFLDHLLNQRKVPTSKKAYCKMMKKIQSKYSAFTASEQSWDVFPVEAFHQISTGIKATMVDVVKWNAISTGALELVATEKLNLESFPPHKRRLPRNVANVMGVSELNMVGILTTHDLKMLSDDGWLAKFEGKENQFFVFEDEEPKVIVGRKLSDELGGRLADLSALHSSALESQLEDIDLGLKELLEKARIKGLPEDWVKKFDKLVNGKVKNVFRTHIAEDPAANGPALHIKLKEGAKLWKAPGQRNYSEEQLKFMYEEIKKLSRYKVIRPTTSSWLSPLLMVRKPQPGQWRLCVDARRLNEVICDCFYPLPDIQIASRNIEGAKYFAKVDILKAFWLVEMKDGGQDLFSFTSPFGNFAFKRVTMGGKPSSAHFQRMIDMIFYDELMSSRCGDWKNYVMNGDVWSAEAPQRPAGRTWTEFGKGSGEQKNSKKEGVVRAGLLSLIDDLLIFSDTLEGLYLMMERVLSKLMKWGLKVHPAKVSLYEEEISWVGILFSPKGCGVDPARVKAIQELGEPNTVAEAMHLVHSVNWVSKHLPKFAEVVEPLRAFDKRVSDVYKKRREAQGKKTTRLKKTMKARMLLKDTDWNPKVEGKAFQALKDLVINSVMCSHWKSDWNVQIHTDASDHHWASILTQISPEDMDKEEKDQKIEVLGFLSGTFRGAQVNYAMCDKESFAVVKSVSKWRPYLYKHFRIYTDHRNLVYLFWGGGADRENTLSVATRGRLQRWASYLMQFDYEIIHIPGEIMEDRWSDLLSRWGSSARMKVVQGKLVNVHAGRECGCCRNFSTPTPTPLGCIPVKAKLGRRKSTRKRWKPDWLSPEGKNSKETKTQTKVKEEEIVVDVPPLEAEVWDCVTEANDEQLKELNLQPRESDPRDSPIYVVKPPVSEKGTLDGGNMYFLGNETSWPTAELTGSSYNEEERTKKFQEAYGLVDRDGILYHGELIYVPQELRSSYVIASHQIGNRHRSKKETSRILRKYCWWPAMGRTIDEIVRCCLHCIKLMDGNTVPRPYGHQLRATRPGQILVIDYLDVESQPFLCIKDAFSQLAWIEATRDKTSVSTAQVLLKYTGTNLNPKIIISDRGSGFVNKVIKELLKQKGIKHHMTTPNSSTGHGSIENLNRQFRKLYKSVKHCKKLDAVEAARLGPMITGALNRMPREILGNRTPLEVHAGFPNEDPFRALLVTGHSFEEALVTPALDKRATKYLKELAAHLDALHAEINVKLDKRMKKRMEENKDLVTSMPEFQVGHYVLVGKTDKEKNKHSLHWIGPCQILRKITSMQYEVRLIGKEHRKYNKLVHVNRMKFFAGADLEITTELKEDAHFGAGELEVQAITNYGWDDDTGRLKGEVHWLGFDEEDDRTWEFYDQLLVDIPEMAKRFLKAHIKNDNALKKYAALNGVSN